MENSQVHQWLEKTRRFLRLDKIPPLPRKIIVCAVGGLLLFGGIIMLLTPGPALVAIPLGLFLLASEFAWAEELAQKILDWFQHLRDKWRRKRSARHPG